MGPHQRARGARGLAAEKFERGDIRGVPNLLGDRAALPDGGKFDHGKQSLRLVRMPRGKCVVSAFPGEKRPGTADSGSVKRRAVFVLPVTVAVVAVPARPLR